MILLPQSLGHPILPIARVHLPDNKVKLEVNVNTMDTLGATIMTRRCLEVGFLPLGPANGTDAAASCLGVPGNNTSICTERDLLSHLYATCSSALIPSITMAESENFDREARRAAVATHDMPVCVVARGYPGYHPEQTCLFFWSILSQFPNVRPPAPAPASCLFSTRS